MTDITVSPSAELAIWGPGTALFQRYTHWKRLFKGGKRDLDLTPITNIQEALVLLHEQMNDGTQRFVMIEGTLPDKTSGPTVRIQNYGNGYTSRVYEFPLAQSVVDELLRSGLLSGTKTWGYTDEKQLRLNEYSTERILEEIRRYAEAHPATPGGPDTEQSNA